MRERRVWLRRGSCWCLRGVLVIVAAALAYGLAAVVLGRVPVNAAWRPPDQGVEIFVVSNGVHADFVLPARSAERDWLAFLGRGRTTPAHWVSLGWGDRRIYIATPEWSDLTLATALHALLVPSATLVHVDYSEWPPFRDERCKRLLLRPREYRRLCEHIAAGFAREDDDRPIRLPGTSYHGIDEFFEGRGLYHLFRTCNEWTNGGLKAAGIRAAVWTPFAWQVLDVLER